MFTAAIMICLIDQPQTYKNCEVINAQYKYSTNEQCWEDVTDKIIEMEKYPQISNDYVVVHVKCIDWFEKDLGLPV